MRDHSLPAAEPLTITAARGNVHGRAVIVNAAMLLAIVLISGVTPVAARDALVEMPPISTGVVRFAIAATLLIMTTLIRGDFRGRAPIAAADRKFFLFAALLCVPINQATYLVGVQRANASHAGLFYALNPVLVFLLTLALRRVRWSRRMGAATLLSFLGAAAIGWDGLHAVAGKSLFVGDLCLLGAVFSWAAFTIVIGPLSERYGVLRTITIVMVLGVVLYAPAYFVDHEKLRWTALSWRAIAGFAYIALLTSYVNYLLWFIAMARMDLNRLAVAANASPIVAVIAAHFWRGETITTWLFVGAALILTAITLANWDRIKALRAATGRSF